MGSLSIYVLLIATFFCSLFRPWIGISAYYLLAILGPQYIWWWNFGGTRASLTVAMSALIGVALTVFTKRVHYYFLNTRLNLFMGFLWFFIIISYFFGAYVSKFDADLYSHDVRFIQNVFSINNNLFLIYFCSVMSVDTLKKTYYLSFIMVASSLFLIYWGNLQYLSENWAQFNFGRLMGPQSIDGSSIYRDENVFGMFFVTSMPFIFYLGKEIKSKILRFALWSFIPFGFHAVFLTASRGGILGLSVVILYAGIRSKKILSGLLIILMFAVLFVWQGGEIMKDRSATITEYNEEASASMRIKAWIGGMRMLAAHPLTGVGLGAFITALPDFIDTKPRVAHNTFIQLAAESGIGAAICYLAIVLLVIKNFLKIDYWCQHRRNLRGVRIVNALNNSCSASFLGFFICSIFLSLNTYEIFFFLMVISNSLSVLCAKHDNYATK